MVLKRFDVVNRKKLEYDTLIPALNSIIKDRVKGLVQVHPDMYSWKPEDVKNFFSAQKADPMFLTNIVIFGAIAIKKIDEAKTMDELLAVLNEGYHVVADFSLSKENIETYCREVDKELWTTDFTRKFMGEWNARTKKPAEGSRMAEGKRGTCEYHLCGKEGQAYLCKYCGKHYCKEHYAAKPADMPPLEPKTYEQRMIAEQWSAPAGHVCPAYSEEAKAVLIDEELKYNRAVENLLSTTKPSARFAVGLKKHSEPEPAAEKKEAAMPTPFVLPKLSKNMLVMGVVALIALLLITAVAVFIYFLDYRGQGAGATTTTTIATTTTMQATTTSTQITTPTTLQVQLPPGCWSYCQTLNPDFKGACMKKIRDCNSFAWSYYKEGNADCSPTPSGLQTFCCCGVNTKFLTLLDADTIPVKDDPKISEYLAVVP